MVSPPLAIANKYQDPDTTQPKRVRYRLILVRASDLSWLRGDRLKDLQAQVKTSHRWIPAQQLPFDETILYAYAAVCTTHARDASWHKLARTRKLRRCQASTSLTGGECIQLWSSLPTYQAPKKPRSVMLKPPHLALQGQNPPGRQKRRHATSSQILA